MKLNLHIEEPGSDHFLLADSLLCLADSDILGYILYNQKQKKIFCWKIWEIENDSDINTIIDRELTSIPDSFSISLLNYTPRYLAIPSNIIASNKNFNFWELNMGYQNQEKIIENSSWHKDICFMHGLNRIIYDQINHRFSNKEWYPIQAIHFMNPIQKAGKIPIQLIFLYKNVHINVYQNGQILLSKAYPLLNPEDTLWQILNIIHNLHLTTDQIELYVEGLIDTHSAIFSLVDQYFERNPLPELTYQFPISDIELSQPTLVHIDRILSCVS